jgi:hypothetical protein
MPIALALSPAPSPLLHLPFVLLVFLSLYSTRGSSLGYTPVVAMASPTLRSPRLIVATRLHLGQSSSPPADDDLDLKVAGFYRFCAESCPNSMGVLAVDATPKIPGYDLVQAVQAACDKAMAAANAASSSTTTATRLHVLPVTPWGKFVPALNALVQFAAASQPLYETDDDDDDDTSTNSNNGDSSYSGGHQILFCSAETTCSAQSVQTLQSHLQADTAVVGACLPGHEYKCQTAATATSDDQQQQKQREPTVVELNGRTSPWNTLALWDLRKLALTGFLLVSDGLLSDDQTDPSFGIEEVVAISLLQRLLGPENAKAKLVQLTSSSVDWNQEFDDPERKKWHEQKMNSKRTRAARQLELTGLSGVVHHC